MHVVTERLEVRSIQLAVHRFVEPSAVPSKRTLLLLHGYMDAGRTWDLVAEHLAPRGYTLIAPDLRGFGDSERVGAGGYYHFADYVADVAALIDRLGLERPGVVGHSMGGTIAALFSGAFPSRVERLALLEGLGPPGHPPEVAVDRMRAWIRGLGALERAPRPLEGLDDAVRRLRFNHPRVPEHVLRGRAAELTRTDDAGRLVWAYDPLHRTVSPSPFQVDGFKAFLREIRCPTLVVDGGPTGWHPVDADERVACLPDARRVSLGGAGHMMHWTAPAELAGELARFFEGLPAQTS